MAAPKITINTDTGPFSFGSTFSPRQNRYHEINKIKDQVEGTFISLQTAQAESSTSTLAIYYAYSNALNKTRRSLADFVQNFNNSTSFIAVSKKGFGKFLQNEIARGFFYRGGRR